MKFGLFCTLKCVIFQLKMDHGIFNCLTGVACASPVEKIAPPVLKTYPLTILLNVRRFVISLNF